MNEQSEHPQRGAFIAGFGVGGSEVAVSVEIVDDLDEDGNVYRWRTRIGSGDWSEWEYVDAISLDQDSWSTC